MHASSTVRARYEADLHPNSQYMSPAAAKQASAVHWTVCKPMASHKTALHTHEPPFWHMGPTGPKLAVSAKVDSGDGGASGGRVEAYDLYEKYEKWKDAIGAYDIMDVAGHLFAALSAHGYRGPRVDEIYVDEVQDFTQAELRLFILVCADKNALFLTGDTCQTIARGVGFRFEELRTMFHELACSQSDRILACGKRLADVPRAELVRVPEVNKLSVNYR